MRATAIFFPFQLVAKTVVNAIPRLKPQTAEELFRKEQLRILNGMPDQRSAKALALSLYFIGRHRCDHRNIQEMKKFLGGMYPNARSIEITSIGYRVETFRNPCASRTAKGTHTIAA